MPSEPRPLDEIIAQGYRVRTLDYLRQGWAAFTNDPVGFLGFAFLLMVAAQAVPLFFPLVGQLVSLAIQVVMLAGLALVTWKHLQSRRTAFEDFFPDWHTTTRLILCTIVGLLLIVVGFFLLIVPGIYLLVGYTFAYMLIVERHLGVWQALEGSRRVVGKHWWGIFVLTLVMVGLVGGGLVIGGAALGLPIGYALSGLFPTVSLDELPLGFPQTGLTLNLGVLIGLLSGMMVGGGLGVAVGGCMLGAAYADIFGLSSNHSRAVRHEGID